MSSFDFATCIQHRDVYGRTVAFLRERYVRLPTFAQLADPNKIPNGVKADLMDIDPDEAHPLNLFRVHWFNDESRRGQTDIPVHVELPSSLTGVEAKVVVALAALFPMIQAHKVLAAYSCLVPRLVSGRFDPTRQRAVWPSTGNYCRGGVAISRILGCRGVAVLPEGMSAERFSWLEDWVSSSEDIIRTPGTESNVKEIYNKCAELERDPDNEIVNQFSEFGNYLGHYHCTGAALGRIFEHLSKGNPDLRLAGFVAASGSAGTLGAGDFLKEKTGARIAVVEPVECPTLLYNGYGEHNIQGIGDKHIPLIHNIMNSDLVIAVSDQATDGLNAVFNTTVGRDFLVREMGVPQEAVSWFDYFGLSSIANILGAIKLAKSLNLGPDDVVLTVATDGAGMYRSELDRYLTGRHKGDFATPAAAEICEAHLFGANTEHVLQLDERDRRRIFNLGYFTWVEQQNTPLADFDRRKSQTFWKSLHGLVPAWDELIEKFNRETGVAAATKEHVS